MAWAEKLDPGPMSGRMNFVVESPKMLAVLDRATRLARSSVVVVLVGESGVGKERVARFIHDNSPCRKGPFVPINCGALAPSLLESEIFGHVRGAFTGADSDRPGKIRAATGGTLLLDEVGDLSLQAQVKLLRAIEGGEVYPVGSEKPYYLRARVVVATNKDLGDLVDKGHFREDFYFRLGCAVVKIPPLRERREDTLAIARACLADLHARGEADSNTFGPEATDALLEYAWPGNIRQLLNVVRVAVALGDPGGLRGVVNVLQGGGSAPPVTWLIPRMQSMLGRKPTEVELKLLRVLHRKGRCSIKALAEAAGLNRETARRRLVPMIEAALVIKGGAKRGAWVAPGEV